MSELLDANDSPFKAYSKMMNAVPTNWIDPLLTGSTAVIGRPPYNCQDIERLLLEIRKRMEGIAGI